MGNGPWSIRVYDHSAVGYVSHAHCILLLYSVGNKITTTTTAATATATAPAAPAATDTATAAATATASTTTTTTTTTKWQYPFRWILKVFSIQKVQNIWNPIYW